jgi:pheromone shutdown-related protein TraB
MSDATDAASSSEAPYPDDVVVLDVGGRRIVVVGTAHVAHESVALVRDVIAREHPDRVCVELDQRRFDVLSQRKAWEASDLRAIIRKRQLATLLVQLLMSSYQKRLGGQLGIVPGSELLEATRAAEAQGIGVELCDRDVRITLRRAWRALSFGKKAMLLSGVVGGLVDPPKVDEEALRELRQRDTLNDLLQQLGEVFPTLKRVLIDERDAFLAGRILAAPGERLVAVVGAGHVQGMKAAIEAQAPVDFDELNHIPPMSRGMVAFGWSIGLAVATALLAIGYTRGVEALGENALYWIVANAVPSGIGTLLALAHPLTVLATAAAAPFTSLTPLIGAGYVGAFVQAYLVPPRVHEFQTAGDDVARPRRWWTSRLLRVLSVFALASIGSLLGTLAGGVEIARTLLE